MNSSYDAGSAALNQNMIGASSNSALGDNTFRLQQQHPRHQQGPNLVSNQPGHMGQQYNGGFADHPQVNQQQSVRMSQTTIPQMSDVNDYRLLFFEAPSNMNPFPSCSNEIKHQQYSSNYNHCGQQQIRQQMSNECYSIPPSASYPSPQFTQFQQQQQLQSTAPPARLCFQQTPEPYFVNGSAQQQWQYQQPQQGQNFQLLAPNKKQVTISIPAHIDPQQLVQFLGQHEGMIGSTQNKRVSHTNMAFEEGVGAHQFSPFPPTTLNSFNPQNETNENAFETNENAFDFEGIDLDGLVDDLTIENIPTEAEILASFIQVSPLTPRIDTDDQSVVTTSTYRTGTDNSKNITKNFTFFHRIKF